MRALVADIKAWGAKLGFQQVGITGIDLGPDEARLQEWLAVNFHGEMEYMHRHGSKRSRPHELIPGTLRVICARMDYWPDETADAERILHEPELAYVSRYALGRDYHKVLRKRLQQLTDRVVAAVGEHGYRVFVDSAPVMEKPLARNAGLGWIGKHTNLINRHAGSWFFLGEIYTDLPLPIDTPEDADHCGRCTVCMDVCPTAAIVAPYQLDARRCISYLTIELRGSIPIEYRPLIGNRVYGCDDCQLYCPWNRFARATGEDDFRPRQDLDASTLLYLFGWSEEEFLHHTQGSAIRRIGYECWLRNVAVALGNAPSRPEVIAALRSRAGHSSALVREHVLWALSRHGASLPPS